MSKKLIRDHLEEAVGTEIGDNEGYDEYRKRLVDMAYEFITDDGWMKLPLKVRKWLDFASIKMDSTGDKCPIFPDEPDIVEESGFSKFKEEIRKTELKQGFNFTEVRAGTCFIGGKYIIRGKEYTCRYHRNKVSVFTNDKNQILNIDFGEYVIPCGIKDENFVKPGVTRVDSVLEVLRDGCKIDDLPGRADLFFCASNMTGKGRPSARLYAGIILEALIKLNVVNHTDVFVTLKGEVKDEISEE